MKTIVAEDTATTRTSVNPYRAAVDAQDRDALAREQHAGFFESKTHNDRVDAVCAILESFFDRKVDYITARGINRKRAFSAVKIEWVGSMLTRTKAKVKNESLYAPLIALKDVEVISKNGHIVVRVY